MPAILWAGIGIFLTGCGSRQHFDRLCDSDSDIARENFRALSETDVGEIPLARTVANVLERVEPEQVSDIAPRMVRSLVRNRVLERYRLLDKHYLVAIDATGWMSFDEPHCEHCLRREHQSGKVTYYHMILEAKVVTVTGMALSIASEFIENVDPDADKQDCEMKALPRLLEKIRAVFPSLSICLLLDGLYASKTTFSLCKKHKLDFLVTFKRGSMPALYGEFETLRDDSDHTRIQVQHEKERQQLAWVNALQYEGYLVHALSCKIENDDEQHQYFAWLSSIPICRDNVQTIANEGGRLRWKIENEGFNVQKNCEYQLEHIYSHHPIAGKNYYLLLQIAHILLQLLLHGALCKIMRSRIRELKNFFRLIKEHFGTRPPSDELSGTIPSCQIRLDTS